MNFSENQIHLVMPKDTLGSLREWIRCERQRADMTQGELARRSGVPATTISRLERTGLASTDAVMRILFALDRIDPLQDFIKERIRLSRFPETLSEMRSQRTVLRVRHAKAKQT